MAVAARRFEPEQSMELEPHLARLDERTEHIQRDVNQLTVDMRRLDAKIDSKIDAVRDSITSLAEKVTSGDTKASDRIAALEVKLSAVEVSMIKWMIGTATTLTALVFGIAKFVS